MTARSPLQSRWRPAPRLRRRPTQPGSFRSSRKYSAFSKARKYCNAKYERRGDFSTIEFRAAVRAAIRVAIRAETGKGVPARTTQELPEEEHPAKSRKARNSPSAQTGTSADRKRRSAARLRT